MRMFSSPVTQTIELTGVQTSLALSYIRNDRSNRLRNIRRAPARCLYVPLRLPDHGLSWFVFLYPSALRMAILKPP